MTIRLLLVTSILVGIAILEYPQSAIAEQPLKGSLGRVSTHNRKPL